jgi:peptidoglycan/LPS O-acetylase OafA/YrhL
MAQLPDVFPFSFDFAPPVVWMLAFEMAFYALFLIAFWNRRAFLICCHIGPIGRKQGIALAGIGLAVFAIAAWLDVHMHLATRPSVALEIAQRHLTPLFGVAGAIWILVVAKSGFALRGLPHKILFFIGNASYAIYLWHLLG